MPIRTISPPAHRQIRAGLVFFGVRFPQGYQRHEADRLSVVDVPFSICAGFLTTIH
jgi:hypothetical protein